MIMKLLSPRIPFDVRGLKQKNVVNAISIDDVPALTLAQVVLRCRVQGPRAVRNRG